MSASICHDFKSPRPDAVKRLPAIFMMVPILFYLAVIGGGLLGVTSWLNIKNSHEQRDSYQAMEAEEETKKADIEANTLAVLSEKQRAEKLALWIEGTRTLQPISVAINRSVAEETTLSELSMQRSLDLPAQINVNVTINNGGMQDIVRIQNAITSLSYRPYNTQQIKNGDNLEFSSMLVWSKQ